MIFHEAQRAFEIAFMLASGSKYFMVEILESCPSDTWSVTINTYSDMNSKWEIFLCNGFKFEPLLFISSYFSPSCLWSDPLRILVSLSYFS